MVVANLFVLLLSILFPSRLNWIEVLGTKYKPGEIVVISVDTVPKFGLISDVIVLDVDNYFIVCEVLHTIRFNSHYHAYEVSRDTAPTFVFLKQSDMSDHSVLGLYNKITFSFVSLKYHITQ